MAWFKNRTPKHPSPFPFFYAGRGGAAAPFAGVRLRAEEKEEREEEERPSGKGALSTWPPCASAPGQRYPSVTTRGEGSSPTPCCPVLHRLLLVASHHAECPQPPALGGDMTPLHHAGCVREGADDDDNASLVDNDDATAEKEESH